MEPGRRGQVQIPEEPDEQKPAMTHAFYNFISLHVPPNFMYEALGTADQIDLDRDYGPGHWPKAKEAEIGLRRKVRVKA